MSLNVFNLSWALTIIACFLRKQAPSIIDIAACAYFIMLALKVWWNTKQHDTARTPIIDKCHTCDACVADQLLLSHEQEHLKSTCARQLLHLITVAEYYNVISCVIIICDRIIITQPYQRGGRINKTFGLNAGISGVQIPGLEMYMFTKNHSSWCQGVYMTICVYVNTAFI